MRRAIIFARTAGVIGVLAIIVLSLVPGPHRPHTWLPGKAEHFVAYCGTASVLALGFHAAASRLGAALGLAVLAGLMEAMQRSVPGRHAAISDALVSAAGGVAGIAIGAILYSAAARAYKSSTAPRIG
jgi:VanZ family protein